MKKKIEKPNESSTQKEWEGYYKDTGWTVISPKSIVDRSKCEHVWEKVKENDYQCAKCLQGWLGSIPEGAR